MSRINNKYSDRMRQTGILSKEYRSKVSKPKDYWWQFLYFEDDIKIF